MADFPLDVDDKDDDSRSVPRAMPDKALVQQRLLSPERGWLPAQRDIWAVLHEQSLGLHQALESSFAPSKLPLCRPHSARTHQANHASSSGSNVPSSVHIKSEIDQLYFRSHFHSPKADASKIDPTLCRIFALYLVASYCSGARLSAKDRDIFETSSENACTSKWILELVNGQEAPGVKDQLAAVADLARRNLQIPTAC